MSSLVTHTTRSQICLMGVNLPRNGSSAFTSKLQQMAGAWTRATVLALACIWTFLFFLIAVSFSPLRLLARCTFPSIKPKLIRGVWRPAMASLDLDLCSLITISDHLVLITLEESTKTLETIHIAAIAAPSNLDSIFMCRALSTSRQFSNRTA